MLELVLVPLFCPRSRVDFGGGGNRGVLLELIPAARAEAGRWYSLRSYSGKSVRWIAFIHGAIVGLRFVSLYGVLMVC